MERGPGPTVDLLAAGESEACLLARAGLALVSQTTGGPEEQGGCAPELLLAEVWERRVGGLGR